jgi:hypothetical protein
MFKRFNKNYVILIILFCFFNSIAGAREMSCITPKEIKHIDEKAQAFIDDIYFNVQVMQGKVGIEEIMKRALDSQIKRYKTGESSQISLTVEKIYVSNTIHFHQAATPKYFIPNDSLISSPVKSKVGLSVQLIEQALGLGKCRMSEDWFNDGRFKEHIFNYSLPSQDIRYPDAYIRIAVNPPNDGRYISGDPVSKTLQDNIRSVEIGRANYAQQQIPALSSGQPVNREGLWKASVPADHPKADLINSSSGVFLQRGEILPSFGLEAQEEKKVKWHWLDIGVEFLKAQKEKASS